MVLLSKPLGKLVWGLLSAGGLEDGAGCWVSHGDAEQVGDQWELLSVVQGGLLSRESSARMLGFQGNKT